MKIFKALSVLAFFIGFSYTAQAQTCTVTTPCNSYSFQTNGVSVSTSTSNGVKTITIYDTQGNVLASETCNAPGSTSSSCSSSSGSGGGNGGGSFDICDRLQGYPAWIRSYYGCN